MAEKFVDVDSTETLSALFGQLDGNISRIQKDYSVTAVSRDGGIKLIGEENNVNAAEKALRALLRISGSGQSLSEQTVRYVTSMVADGVESELEELGGDGICVTASGKILRPRTDISTLSKAIPSFSASALRVRERPISQLQWPSRLSVSIRSRR